MLLKNNDFKTSKSIYKCYWVNVLSKLDDSKWHSQLSNNSTVWRGGGGPIVWRHPHSSSVTVNHPDCPYLPSTVLTGFRLLCRDKQCNRIQTRVRELYFIPSRKQRVETFEIWNCVREKDLTLNNKALASDSAPTFVTHFGFFLLILL